MNNPEENSENKNENEDTVSPIKNDDIELNTSEESNINNESKINTGIKSNEDSIVINKETNIENEPNTISNTETPKKFIPSFPINTYKANLKEKPKVNYKKNNDDIEEFDTDEEEEEEEEKEEKEEKTSTPGSNSQQNYSEHISYEGDKCIYTEPGTGRKLIWNSKENKWCADEKSGENANAPEAAKNYEFDGKHYVYTDKETNVTYKFIQEKNEWVVKGDEESDEKNNDEEKPPSKPAEGIYGFENDTHTYTDPSDGTSYIWDREKSAWFPKVDDDFMARYQMSYGFTDFSSTSTSVAPKTPPKSVPAPKLTKEEKKAENKRKAQELATWFEVDDAHNTTIYISNLPEDTTVDEVKELVTKCGLLARDEKGKDKLKLYIDINGELKGDARCTYIKVESVDLALNILDGWKLRGKTLSVQRAKFQLRGQYDPSLKPKRKKKDKEKQKKIQEKLLDWRPDRMRGEPLKCERVVILKNLFQPEDFDKDVTLLLEYQQDVRSECVKCGEVKKVTIYDRHPEGVAQVTFKEPEEAQACIQLLNGRWFGQRRITAEIWDGKTKYKIRETEEQIEARINKWDKYLEDKEDAEDAAKKEKEAHSQSTSSAATV